jgi:hypothetical protein
MSYTTVSSCGNDHLEWLKSIDFYKEEFERLEEKLVEIVKKNNVPEAMAGVEHFQNQFMIQRNNIAKLRHSIHEHSGKIASEAKIHAGKMETFHIGEHNQLRDQFESFEKIVSELRHEFSLFLAKWM